MTTPQSPATGPVRVAVVNDHELVVRGLAAMLEPYAERVVVVELDSVLPVESSVDIALYDAFSMPRLGDGGDDWISGGARVDRTVLYTWVVDDGVVAQAQDLGASGVIPKSVGAAELVSVLERVRAGEEAFDLRTTGEADGEETFAGGWPGKAQGLTPRQSEIIALITEGLGNQEIARRTYLSINSVKSYIRAAYRTMGVTSRSQAVLWGIDHGFTRDRRRIVRTPTQTPASPDHAPAGRA